MSPTDGPGPADLALVRRVLAGDPEAGRAYAKRMLCVPRILAVQNRRSGRQLGEHDLADLSQDVLVLVWRKLAEFQGAAALETWVFRFCYLQYMTATREKARQRARYSEGPVGHEPAAPTGLEGRFEDLYEGIERLPAAERQVIRLRLSRELTFDEIGRFTGQPTSTIKSRYYRALERLSTFLGRGSSLREGGNG